MTARTRQTALCLDGAFCDIRNTATDALIDGIARSAVQTAGAQFLQRNSALIDQWIAERRERERGQ